MRYAVPILMLAVVGFTPATAQVRRSAVVRTNASTAILQPAMITSSQDLMFVVSTSNVGALTPGTTSIAAPTTTTSITSATATRTGSAGTAPTQSSSGVPAPAGALLMPMAGGSLSGAVPAPARATFTVAGDAGQSISVTVPDAVDLTRAGGAEMAVLTTQDSLGDRSQILGGNFASTGTLSFNVGGQVTLAGSNVASGTYNGVLAVIAQYN